MKQRSETDFISLFFFTLYENRVGRYTLCATSNICLVESDGNALLDFDNKLNLITIERIIDHHFLKAICNRLRNVRS